MNSNSSNDEDLLCQENSNSANMGIFDDDALVEFIQKG